MKSKTISILGLAIWSLAVIFYFYEFFLSVVLGTFATRLMHDLHLGAEEFSILAAAYFITYSMMQTPVGILVDRFGVRRLLTLATFICAFGVLWFSFSDHFAPALISRFLMGFGSSFAFISLLVLALNWFPLEYFGLFSSTAQFLGSVGPLLAGGPTAFILEEMGGDWRSMLFWLGIFGLILAVSFGFFLRNKPKGKRKALVHIEAKADTLKQRLGFLFQNTQVWVIVMVAATSYVTLPLLGAYWGTTYLESRGLPKTSAATITSMIWLGVAFGSLILVKISSALRRRKPLLYVSTLLGIIVSLLVLYIVPTDPIILAILFFLMGFASSAQAVTFPTIAERVPKKLRATAVGLNNTFIILFAGVIPPFASTLIERAKNQASYTREDFTIGLSVIPIFYALAFLLSVFGVKETFCRQQHEIYKVDKHI